MIRRHRRLLTPPSARPINGGMSYVADIDDDEMVWTNVLGAVRASLAEAGEPLSADDEVALAAEWRDFLHVLTPPPPPLEQRRITFAFNDLPRLDGHGITTVTRCVPFESLAMALIGADPDVVAHVMSGMAHRHCAMLRKLVAELTSAATEQTVAPARERIVAKILDLAAAGRIVISEGPDV